MIVPSVMDSAPKGGSGSSVTAKCRENIRILESDGDVSLGCLKSAPYLPLTLFKPVAKARNASFVLCDRAPEIYARVGATVVACRDN